MNNKLYARMQQQMQSLQQDGLLRRRQIADKSLLNFAANDYLGLADSSVLAEAGRNALEQQACGSGASPLVTGYSQAHFALEQALCERTGHEAALLFCSGFSANNALMKTLFRANDNVQADKLVHASIIDGLLDSGANCRRFLHNDMQSAARLAQKLSPLAILTETVFSMDGDCAPLESLRILSLKHNAWLIVDDAHGFAVPKGKVTDCNVALCDVQLVTFGKALGCQGAALLGSREFVDFMVANCRHYIYSTALSPLAATIALAALKATANGVYATKLAENIQLFKSLCETAEIKLMPSDTAIQPLVLGSSELVIKLADRLKKNGILVGAIRPPTVSNGSARLRITLTAKHTDEQIYYLVKMLSQSLDIPL